MITIDTDQTLYICSDKTNEEVHVFSPRSKSFVYTEHYILDDPDPYGPNKSDRSIFNLLRETNMCHEIFYT
jgi:hypothetical protein